MDLTRSFRRIRRLILRWKHATRVRRAARRLQSRSFEQLETQARAYTRGHYARRMFPRLRFVFWPTKRLGFALSEEQQKRVHENYAHISRLWAHVSPMVTLVTLSCLWPSPLLIFVTTMYCVLMNVIYFALLVDDNRMGIWRIISIRYGIANELVCEANRKRQTFLAEDLAPLSVSVGALMEHRLIALDEEMIGERSRLCAVQEGMRRYHDEAMRRLERQRARAREFPNNAVPAQIASILKGFEDVIARYATVLAQLDQFRARIGAYMDECRARVRGLVAEVADLEAVRKLAALQRQVAQDERLAANVVAATLAQLQTGMLELRRDVLSRENLAREIVAELPYSGDIGGELDRIEEILGRATDTARLRVPA